MKKALFAKTEASGASRRAVAARKPEKEKRELSLDGLRVTTARGGVSVRVRAAYLSGSVPLTRGRGGVASPRSSVDWEGARGWIVAAGMAAAHFASRKLLGAR